MPPVLAGRGGRTSGVKLKAGRADLDKPPDASSSVPHVKPVNGFERIARVEGKVLSAKGLPRSGGVFCVVKGIRSNNHLVDICTTTITSEVRTPSWRKAFKFECPEVWGLSGMLGLKFQVFGADERQGSAIGTDDFLGGADVDLSQARRRCREEYTLPLEGGRKLHDKKKPRLMIELCVWYELTDWPPEAEVRLQESLQVVTRVLQVDIHSLYALGVDSSSRTTCHVRAVMCGGFTEQLFRAEESPTSSSEGVQYAVPWQYQFRENDCPMVLIFDIVCGETHLGSAALCLLDCAEGNNKHRLLLGPALDWFDIGEASAEPNGFAVSEQKGLVRKATRFSTLSLDSEENQGQTLLGAAGRRGIFASASSAVGKLRQMLRRKINQKIAMLHVDVAVIVDSVAMPHLSLMSKPQLMEYTEDIATAANEPDWDASMFDLPPEMEVEEDWWEATSTLMQPFSLRGKNHVVFIYGQIVGAYGLAPSDALGAGKRDPYCVVEAGASASAPRVFLHRTRTIPGRLTPAWREAFYLPVHETTDVQLLWFTVYDEDGTQDTDQVLGSATIDLRYMCNNAMIAEEVPLLGGPKVQGSSNAYRSIPRISYELRVERRIKPVVDFKQEMAHQDPAPRPHTLSRVPPRTGRGQEYIDPAQMDRHEDMCRSSLVAKAVPPAQQEKPGRASKASVTSLASRDSSRSTPAAATPAPSPLAMAASIQEATADESSQEKFFRGGVVAALRAARHASLPTLAAPQESPSQAAIEAATKVQFKKMTSNESQALLPKMITGSRSPLRSLPREPRPAQPIVLPRVT